MLAPRRPRAASLSWKRSSRPHAAANGRCDKHDSSRPTDAETRIFAGDRCDKILKSRQGERAQIAVL